MLHSWQHGMGWKKLSISFVYTTLKLIISLFCIPVCGEPEACKRRENPEGERRSLCLMEVSKWCWSQKVEGVLFCSCWSVCFLHVFRGQFCCKRIPSERDGGMWEVQRGGAQAEEHAGIGLFYFICLLDTYYPMSLFCFPVCLKWNEKEHEFSGFPTMTNKTVATASMYSKKRNTELGLDRCSRSSFLFRQRLSFNLVLSELRFCIMSTWAVSKLSSFAHLNKRKAELILGKRESVPGVYCICWRGEPVGLSAA